MIGKHKVLSIGCDHAGYDLKEFLKEELQKSDYMINDYGTFTGESVDYPDIIHPLAKHIDENDELMGIIICGSGNGASMTANKYQHVRAALCWNDELAKLARLHNNANILGLPARFIEKEQALRMVEIFLNTAFEGGRHQKRVEKIAVSK